MDKIKPKLKLIPASENDLDFIIDQQLNIKSKHYYVTGEPETAKEFFKNSNIYFIDYNGEKVGYISYEVNGSQAYLNDLLIKKEFHNIGIGTEAVDMICNKLKSVNIKNVWLVVHPENKNAIRVYEKNGFIVEAEHSDYWGDGEKRLRMVRSID